MRTFAWFTAAAAAGLLAGPACAATPELIEAAKKEGEVVWYTSQIIDPLVLRLTDAFKKKYGIQLKPVRANSAEIALRIVNEARGGKHLADIYGGQTTSEALKQEGLALKWLPPNIGEIPKDFVDPDGYWMGTNFTLMTAAYNTDLIKPGAEPKTWDDLLAPSLKGKMVWGNAVSTSAGAGFIGLVLKTWGEEKGMDYLRKLARQDITGSGGSARQVIDMTIAGEFAVSLQIFPEHAASSAEKGAPVKWIPTRPGMASVISTSGVPAKAPHMNAAKLFMEYMISEEGQIVFRDSLYSPINFKVAPLDKEFAPSANPYVVLTPKEAFTDMPRWFSIFKELYR
jgi:ABC-type Fe3+ transport system substrate-binding protein